MFSFRKKGSDDKKVDLFENAKNGDLTAQLELADSYYKAGSYEDALEYYKKAARAGSAKACFRIGNMYLKGIGVTNDAILAEHYFNSALRQGYEKEADLDSILEHHQQSIKDYEEGINYWEGNNEDKKKDGELGVRLLLKSAESGYAPAQAKLGLIRYYGLKIVNNEIKTSTPDTKDGLNLLNLAARQRNVTANLALGTIYSEGSLYVRNIPEAIKCLTFAANKGNAEAQFKLGNLYLKGTGVPQNFQTAMNFYKLAVKNKENFTKAQSKLAYLYAKTNTAESLKEAKFLMNIIQRKAEEKDSEAQFEVYQLFIYFQEIFPSNQEERASLLQKSADGGCVEAQYNLGVKFRRQNRSAMARPYFLLAAEKNSNDALNELGVLAEKSRNQDQTLLYYDAAIEQGSVEACYNLAHYLAARQSTVIRPDLLGSTKFYLLAAKHGSNSAVVQLAKLGLDSSGAKLDKEHAFEIFKNAAEKMDGLALYETAICYEGGRGVTKDYKESAYNYYFSAKCGNQKAINALSHFLVASEDFYQLFYALLFLYPHHNLNEIKTETNQRKLTSYQANFKTVMDHKEFHKQGFYEFLKYDSKIFKNLRTGEFDLRIQRELSQLINNFKKFFVFGISKLTLEYLVDIHSSWLNLITALSLHDSCYYYVQGSRALKNKNYVEALYNFKLVIDPIEFDESLKNDIIRELESCNDAKPESIKLIEHALNRHKPLGFLLHKAGLSQSENKTLEKRSDSLQKLCPP